MWWYIPIIISNQTIVKFEFGVLLILELLVVAIFQPLESLHRTVSNMAVEKFVTDSTLLRGGFEYVAKHRSTLTNWYLKVPCVRKNISTTKAQICMKFET